MSEPRTRALGDALAPMRLPTVASHAARASSSGEIVSLFLILARILPARSIGAELNSSRHLAKEWHLAKDWHHTKSGIMKIYDLLFPALDLWTGRAVPVDPRAGCRALYCAQDQAGGCHHYRSVS